MSEYILKRSNQMVKNISSITINSSAQKVWEALTKPELVKKWQYGSDLITDWKIGGEIRFKTEWNGTVFEQWGKVMEVIPRKRIKYSLFAPRPGIEDKPENYFIMIYSLKQEKDGIKLEIIQEDDRPGATQESDNGEENPVLLSLKKLIES
jgi:uncharacterized protein YndB with AHSA1/START domain